MEERTIRSCTTDDVGAVAHMLGEAFVTDAAYQYLMPDAATRAAGLRDFFEGNVSLHLAHRCTHVMVDARQQVMATVTLRPPRGIHISALTMVRRGLLPFAWAHGLPAVKRLFWLKETYEALEQAAAARERHWYVHMMAVRPDLQGKGIGSRLLAAVMNDAQRIDESAPTVLTTHLSANVTYYQRAGFQVIDQRELTPPSGDRYTVWSMRKAATSPARA